MRFSVLVGLMAVLMPGALRGGPAEAAIAIAMKLTDAQNYSWTADVVDDARTYVIDGMTDRSANADYSVVTMPLLAALRRGPGRGGATTASSTLYFKGDEKFVIETPDGWKKSEDLAGPNSRSGPSRGGGFGRGGRMGGRRGGLGGMGGMGGPGGREGRDGSPPAYSNLQQTLSRPHEEIAILVAGFTDLKSEADGVSGGLSETNAKLLLVHAGQTDITPQRASGSFRIWVKDGRLAKYEVKLEGRLLVATPGGQREVDVHQTTTTTLRAVDTTKFEMPEAAKKKLSA